jgi:anthranilate phosphoribosyltransferase
MLPLEELTRHLLEGEELSSSHISAAAQILTGPENSDEAKAAFLRALAVKGESAGEIANFAREFRKRAIDPGVDAWSAEAIDIVGTGGDHAGGFNISTLVVLTLACCGVTVMKHGNRGITSKCGSADLFAALGVKIDAPPEKTRRALQELGFAFFFAPAYHPSFKHIAPVRKALAAEGQRTIFNILGPLVNPGRPARILLGVFAHSWVAKMADALEELGVEAGLAVHGSLSSERGIDELTTATPNRVRGVGRLRSVDATWQAEDYGFAVSPFDHLRGGDVAENLAIVEAILSGRGPQGLVDTIIFNTAVALWISGRVSSVRDGALPARDMLLGGRVKAKIAATREFFAA